MFFKNATLFRIAPSLLARITAARTDEAGEHVPTELEAALAELPLNPIGALDLSTDGFIAPFGGDTVQLAVPSGDCVLVTLAGERKILPPAAVNNLLVKKIAEHEKQHGRKPGGRLRKAMKEEILHELLPKALTKPFRTSALLNVKLGFVAVDASSRKAAESIISAIRRALGSFPAIPLNAQVAPRNVMTGWIGGEELAEGLSLGDECELKDAMEGGAVVRVRGQELLSDEISKHLEAGKQATKVALFLDDHVSFTVDESLTIRKIKLLDGAIDSLENMEHEDLQAELHARLALFGAELARVFEVIEPAFDLSSAED